MTRDFDIRTQSFGIITWHLDLWMAKKNVQQQKQAFKFSRRANLEKINFVGGKYLLRSTDFVWHGTSMFLVTSASLIPGWQTFWVINWIQLNAVHDSSHASEHATYLRFVTCYSSHMLDENVLASSITWRTTTSQLCQLISAERG